MIAEIRLQQYRSYLDEAFKLSPGLNVVVGPNASGKTNLLESLLVICKGGSFRAPDSELIMHNKEWARIDSNTDQGQRSLKLSHTSKEFTINNKPYKRLSSSLQIPVVLFEPNHLLMLSGSPELRRNYLDGILDYIRPGYKKIRTDYLKTLRQRNALLKSGRANMNELFPWNVRLSHLGGIIATQRVELINELNEPITDAYRRVSDGKEQILLKYKPSADLNTYESQLINKLEQAMDLDLIRGFTSYGPHREDMEVLINKKSPLQAASRGEARTIVLSLKTIEAKIIRRKLDKKPIILLDDIFSELDNSRKDKLTSLLSNSQVIITSTNSNNPLKTKQNTNVIKTHKRA